MCFTTLYTWVDSGSEFVGMLIYLICVKLSSVIGLLWRIKEYLSYRMRIYYYKAFILSCLNYCIDDMEGATSILMNKLYKLQKRAARTV